MRQLILVACLVLAMPVWGQWGDVGEFLSSNNKSSTASWAVTVNATLNSGNAGVCVLAGNNIGTAQGDNNDHTSVSDSDGNNWAEAVEHTNAAAANGACTVSVWTTVAGADLASPDQITFNFASAIGAMAALCREFTIGASNVISTEGTPTTSDGDNSQFASLASASVTSAEYNFVRGFCNEGDADTTGMTATTNFTSWGYTSTDGAGESTNMGVAAEHRIVTSTQQTSAPSKTGDTTSDWASGFPILKEAEATAAAPKRRRVVWE